MGHSRPRKNAQRKSGQEDKGDAIPDELLGLVFLRLTSPLDLVRAAFACRSWRKVIAAEDFRVLSARHGAPSSIVAGHYHISFSHCHYRPLFLGAALHGEDAAARISLSNYRVTCLIYHDGICKTCVFSPGPGGHAWTSSGAIVPLHATHTGRSDILFVGCNARFFQWYVFGGLGNFILALDRESGELSRFERARDEDWLHTVPIEMLGGPSRVLNWYVLELPWPPTFRACLS
ncbi:hypothetical protein QYE76_009522 [Lolium multiflorum]|uniref:F-box domain-containing protein n=1 Tax=Lolium multiflorum TaxID=4521 RepID=A0AAD8X251_LOLMU|nr:hypothetical protein QYE76_009522 [Lolium multiflorum]